MHPARTLSAIAAAAALLVPSGALAAQQPLEALHGAGERPDASGAVQPAPRIVGGNATTNAKYPWQALLLIGTTEGTGLCGGSLIHPYLVVTAAHCVAKDDGALNNIVNVQVWLGRTELGSGGQDHGAWDIYVHPDYSGVTGGNDVAFISLDQPSSGPRILLAGPTEGALWSSGSPAWVTGWGLTSPSGGDPSAVLKQAFMRVVADWSCSQRSVWGEFFKPATMLCSGQLKGGSGACQGDSGGPLQAPIDGGGQRLIGVVSWGSLPCAIPTKPAVYARVGGPPLLDFVRDSVQEIEQLEGLPGAPVDVIGSGARPRGCGAAQKRVGRAQRRLRSARAARQRARRALRRSGAPRAARRLRRATKRVRRARNATGGAIATRNRTCR